MEEIWADIPGFEKYEISTSGTVRHKTHKKTLTYTYPSNDYPQVRLSRNGKKTGLISKCVHQLMAIAFLRPPLKDEEINHKDGNRENPSLENLEILPRKKHREIHRGRIKIVCPGCGKEFRSSDVNKRYCSHKCRESALGIIRTKKSTSRITQSCPICGKEFEIFKSQAERHAKKYCSIECHKLAFRVARICRICGKKFEIFKSQAKAREKDNKHGLYCSRKCSYIGKKGQKYKTTKKVLSTPPSPPVTA